MQGEGRGCAAGRRRQAARHDGRRRQDADKSVSVGSDAAQPRVQGFVLIKIGQRKRERSSLDFARTR